MMKLDIRAATCCALLIAPGAGMAANCTLRNLVSFPVVGSNEIVIKQNIPVGGLVRELVASGDNAIMATCDGRTSVDSTYISLVPSDVPDVYRTDLEGLGVKFEWEPTGGVRRAFPFTVEVDQPVRYDLTNAGRLYVSFYRIAGNFTGGSLSPSGSTEVAQTLADSVRVRRIMFDNIPFRLATCSITTRSLNQTVPLGRHTARDFTDGAGPWRDFSMESETCDLANFSEARFTFSGETPDGYPNLFAIDSGATAARGVAVQLKVRDGELIEPGQLVTTPAVAEGARYDFQARYMRTRDALGSGVGNSTITVNVTYD